MWFTHYLCGRFRPISVFIQYQTTMYMKLSHFLFLAILGLSVGLVACNSKKDDAATQEDTSLSPDGSTIPSNTMGDPNATASTGSTTSGGKELHYKCTKAGCTGGGDAQGKCPICGTDLVHNQAFHAQAQPEGSSPTNPIQIAQPGADAATPATPPAGDGKNAKGEFHYKCTKAGCAGGGSTQVACPVCGSPTAHNQAYHN